MRLQRNKTILSVLCIFVCLSFTACNRETNGEKDSPRATNSSLEDVSSEDTSSVLPLKEFDISLPQEITMELFGLNLLKVNRPIWEEHIFSLNELGEDDYIYTTFPIGDYEVTHSYLNFENKGNFSSYIQYNGTSRCAQVLFDENDNLSKIDIISDMGKEFSTSFLYIGDNAKEYLESFKPGLWNKFLDGERLVDEQGWYIYHSTAATPDYTYDVLQVSGRDILLSYFLKDELVDYIILTVIGENPLNDGFEAEPSIYDLNRFDYCIYGRDIATMSAKEWMDLFNFKEYEEEDKKFKEQWMSILDFSENHFKKEELVEYCSTILAGNEVEADFYYSEQTDYKFINVSMSPVTETPLGDNNTCDIDYGTSTLYFSINKYGNLSIELCIDGEFPMITSNFIMPGDNIRTFFNSYEDGLYEKIVSLADPFDEYCIGPYSFQYERSSEYEGGMISIRKFDERSILPISIAFENEIVTRVYHSYRGTITGFEEETSLW